MKTDVFKRNNLSIRGSGTQPMLFAHGFGCDQGMWRLVAPAFEDDYRVILFDYIGFGRSDLTAYDPKKYDRLEGYVQDVLDICSALNLKNTIFVGHSVSSIIGVLAAIQEPKHFSRLVMIGPSPRYINDPPYVGGFEKEDIEGLLDLMERNYVGWAQVLAANVMKNPDRPELTDELANLFCSTDPLIARKFAEATFFADNRRDLENFPVPSLVLQCSEDSIAPDEVGAYVHRMIARGTLRKLAATGHCPQMSHPEELIAAIRDYLKGN